MCGSTFVKFAPPNKTSSEQGEVLFYPLPSNGISSAIGYIPFLNDGIHVTGLIGIIKQNESISSLVSECRLLIVGLAAPSTVRSTNDVKIHAIRNAVAKQ